MWTPIDNLNIDYMRKIAARNEGKLQAPHYLTENIVSIILLHSISAILCIPLVVFILGPSSACKLHKACGWVGSRGEGGWLGSRGGGRCVGSRGGGGLVGSGMKLVGGEWVGSGVEVGGLVDSRGGGG